MISVTFILKDNIIYTPAFHNSILLGITRNTVITIVKELGYKVIESNIPREMLVIADEVFLVGTAVEIINVESINNIIVGNGSCELTDNIRKLYKETVQGTYLINKKWVTMVGKDI